MRDGIIYAMLFMTMGAVVGIFFTQLPDMTDEAVLIVGYSAVAGVLIAGYDFLYIVYTEFIQGEPA